VKQFKVRAADVDFVTFDERTSGLTIEHAGISSYTATSHSAALKPAPPRDEAAQQLAAAKVEDAKQKLPVLCQRLSGLEAKAERTKEEDIDCAVLVARIMELNRLVRGILVEGSADKVVDTKLMNTGRRYEGIRVQVAGKGVHKGFRGTIIGDHDNEARVRWLAKKRVKAEDFWHDEDQEGILVTIKNEMGHSTVIVPVDKCIHEL
jgi:hypothetical protein